MALDFNFFSSGTFDDTSEQRRETYEEFWKEGDFRYWLATYKDMLLDEAANRKAYNFWRDETRARINNPSLHEKFAPTVQPHTFGCKRISLGNGYFEIFNQDNVRPVDINEPRSPRSSSPVSALRTKRNTSLTT